MNEMKPIEKYRQKFIELLQEAEDELGGEITVKVSSRIIINSSIDAFSSKTKEYRFFIGTNNDFI